MQSLDLPKRPTVGEKSGKNYPLGIETFHAHPIEQPRTGSIPEIAPPEF